MRTFLKPILAALAGSLFSSCMYDPYYPGDYQGDVSTRVDRYAPMSSGSYTTQYVQTYDDDWGYDPQTYMYFQYSTRRFYDPYQGGFYQRGYIPSRRSGRPPSGWHPGVTRMRAPSGIRNRTISHSDFGYGGGGYGGGYRNENRFGGDRRDAYQDRSQFQSQSQRGFVMDSSRRENFRNGNDGFQSRDSRWQRNSQNVSPEQIQMNQNQQQTIRREQNWNRDSQRSGRDFQRNRNFDPSANQAAPVNREQSQFAQIQQQRQQQQQQQPRFIAPPVQAPVQQQPAPTPAATEPTNSGGSSRPPSQFERIQRENAQRRQRI